MSHNSISDFTIRLLSAMQAGRRIIQTMRRFGVDPNGPFEDTELDNGLSHHKRSNEGEPISLTVGLRKHLCVAANPSLKGYVPREMCSTANYGYNSDLLRNATLSG